MDIASYELLEIIGRGGMGTVHRARCRKTGTIVALKIMTAERAGHPILQKRFEQEFLTACRLRHPHLVQGLDFGLHNDQPYLVMEYVAGKNLVQRIREMGPLSPDEAVRLILQIADAVQLAHDHRLVHRDIKPENILITEDGAGKLIDLGLIKDLQADVSLTHTGACLGSINYMAPEQFDDAKYVDHRCDIYALGATLYFALTGVVPFQGRINVVVLGKKLARDFVLPRQLVPHLNPRLEQIISLALEPEPEQRLATCADFSAALRDTLLQAPVAPFSEPAGPNRREAERIPVSLEAACEHWPDRVQRWLAEIVDVSRTGIRLQLDRRVAPGTILAVQVLDNEHQTAVSLWVRVCWERDAGSGHRWLGCAFTRPLSQSELQGLLATRVTTVILPPQNEDTAEQE